MSCSLARSVALSIVAALSAYALPRDPAKHQDAEPPQLFTLECGDQRIPLTVDQPFALDTLPKSGTATLRLAPYRVFPYGGTRFHYPTTLAFDADFGEMDVPVWTLSGDACTAVIQLLIDETDAAITLDEMVASADEEDSGGETIEVEGRDLVLGGKAYPTRHRRMKTDDVFTEMEATAFTTPAGVVVLWLQDDRADPSIPTAEYAALRDMLRETFVIEE